jgi:2-polyprenyl-3-methyl-5-hydroxy-6-metoxy-1,4-benzoquinol methylase
MKTMSDHAANKPQMQKLSEKEICPDDLLSGQEEVFARDVARLQARLGEFISEPCPACGSKDGTHAFEKWRFQYTTCSCCGTIYMNPRPSPAVMQSYYSNSENYAYWGKFIFPASEAARKEKIHLPRHEQIVEMTHRFGTGHGLMLEVGPGFGTFCSVATEAKAFKRVVGIEPTPEMARACRERGVEVIEKRIEDIIDADGLIGADVVVAFEVVEHLYAPRKFVEQCARLLKPGGLLVLTCPNGQGFDIAELGPKSLAVDPEHVNLFNPHSISKLVATCGFHVLELSTPGRLDAEFVRESVLKNQYDVSNQPFLRRILIDEWETLGWPFQQFLAENGLSGHLSIAARKD